MKKQFLLNSMVIAGLVVMLSLTTTVSAYTIDSDVAVNYGVGLSMVRAEVQGYTNGGNYYQEYYASQRAAYYATPVGLLHTLCWVQGDYDHITTASNFDSNWRYVDTPLAATYTYSEFSYQGETFYLDATAAIP